MWYEKWKTNRLMKRKISHEINKKLFLFFFYFFVINENVEFEILEITPLYFLLEYANSFTIKKCFC